MSKNLCIGGANSAALENEGGEQGVQDYLGFFGFAYNPNDPLASLYAPTAASVEPRGLSGTKFESSWLALAEACMRTRQVLFCTSTPGDCSPAFSVKIGASTTPTLAAETASLALQGTQIGESLEGIAGAASTLGLVTLGIGAVLGPILSIFTHHAQAVAQQANALCTLCPKATETILQIDEAVGTGQASPQEGITALQQLAIQFKGAVSQLTKSCNAFCAYGGILDAIAAISPYYYQGAPTTALTTPQAAPVQVSQNVPVSGATNQNSSSAPQANILVPGAYYFDGQSSWLYTAAGWVGPYSGQVNGALSLSSPAVYQDTNGNVWSYNAGVWTELLNAGATEAGFGGTPIAPTQGAPVTFGVSSGISVLEILIIAVIIILLAVL